MENGEQMGCHVAHGTRDGGKSEEIHLAAWVGKLAVIMEHHGGETVFADSSVHGLLDMYTMVQSVVVEEEVD